MLTTSSHHDLAQAKAGQAGPVKGGPRDLPASRLFRTLQCYFCPTGRGQARLGQARPGQARQRGDPVIGRQVVCFVLSSAISALPGEARPGPAKPGQARPGRPWDEAILTLFTTLGRPWEAILTLFATLLYRIDTASHELGNPGRSTASKPTCF